MRASFFSTFVAGSLLLLALAACQPQTVQAPATVEVLSTVVVERTQIVTVPVTVTPPAYVTPHPILSDLRVRQGIAHCTDRAALIAAAYPWLPDPTPLEMDSFVPRGHWAYAETIRRYPFDPQRGKALLEEAGWSLPEGATYRQNADGEELALKLTTTDAALRKAWASVFEEQMQACGLRIVRFHTPASWFFGDTTGLLRRDFELAAFAWALAYDPGGRTQYLCDSIPAPANDWSGQNYMGWCNDAADAAIRTAMTSLSRVERRESYRIFQEAFTRDLPSLPLFSRPIVSVANPALENFAPGPSGVYTWNAARWRMPDKDSIVLGEGSEPASLFALENAYVSQVISALVHGLDYDNLNYDYQPIMLKQLPSLENGAVTVRAVEAREGETVVDADGNVVDLQSGDRLIGADGRDFEFSAGEAHLNQWVVNYEFVDGLTWSDGTPVSRADYELAYRVLCDPETGAAEFLELLPACEKIAQVDFVSDTAYVVTWLPGYQEALYFLPPFSRQPAHMVLSDGRRLADVPASQWLSLPEVTSTPLGVGPYVVKEWEYGRRIVLTANPHYYAGPPATPNIIVRFVEQDQIMSALRSGEIDVLGWDSINFSQAEDLLKAQEEGVVRVFMTPSNSYEHIDFNLFVP